MSDTIQDGKVVSLTYILTSEGAEVERATKEDPVEYLHGAENIVPGLETALIGKKVGDKLNVTLEPQDGYGDYYEDDMDEVERDDIPTNDIEVGMELILEDDEGNLFEAYIKEISADTVLLDFNPPLAGKTLTYDVEVMSIRDADEEELEHGHVHGDEDWVEDFIEED